MYRRLVNSILFPMSIAVSLVGVVAIWTFVPRLETLFWPVTSTLHDVVLTPLPNGRTQIDYRFNKYRGYCELVDWVAFTGIRSGVNDVVLPERIEEGAEIVKFPEGEARGRPHSIDLSIAQIQTDTRMAFIHRCHPLWQTTTWIWPNPKGDEDANTGS
jgi:hypothetical protein